MYLLLVLAADRWGMSFYSRERMSEVLKASVKSIEKALGGLVQKDLIVCDGMVTQVLSLLSEPVKKTLRRPPERREPEPEGDNKFDISEAMRELFRKKGWSRDGD